MIEDKRQDGLRGSRIGSYQPGEITLEVNTHDIDPNPPLSGHDVGQGLINDHMQPR